MRWASCLNCGVCFRTALEVVGCVRLPRPKLGETTHRTNRGGSVPALHKGAVLYPPPLLSTYRTEMAGVDAGHTRPAETVIVVFVLRWLKILYGFICGVPDGEPSIAVALQRNVRVQAQHLLTAPEAGSRPDDVVGGGFPTENAKAVVVSHTGFPWSGATSESHNIVYSPWTRRMGITYLRYEAGWVRKS